MYYCLATYVKKDGALAAPIVEYLYKHWPRTDSKKQGSSPPRAHTSSLTAPAVYRCTPHIRACIMTSLPHYLIASLPHYHITTPSTKAMMIEEVAQLISLVCEDESAVVSGYLGVASGSRLRYLLAHNIHFSYTTTPPQNKVLKHFLGICKICLGCGNVKVRACRLGASTSGCWSTVYVPMRVVVVTDGGDGMQQILGQREDHHRSFTSIASAHTSACGPKAHMLFLWSNRHLALPLRRVATSALGLFTVSDNDSVCRCTRGMLGCMEGLLNCSQGCGAASRVSACM